MKSRNATEPFDGLAQRLAVHRIANEGGIGWPYEIADLPSISHQHIVKSRCPAIGSISNLRVAIQHTRNRQPTSAHNKAL